ncbi:unnamed protein product [Symbiodinium microadriaticum]|nr:unnamed protein product [Symbiodinium microadriaticum]CAE7942118.1 unnamed protein product [Symbiodinium sp. KB8]
MEVEKLEEPDKISEKVPVESEPVARQSRPLAFWPSRTQGLLPLWSLPMPSRMSLVRVPRWPPMPSRLAIAEVKLAIEGTDGEKRSELAPAERTSRIAAQKARLCGYDLTGTIEAWQKLAEIVPSIKRKDQKGDRGTKRDSEAKEKRPPELPDAFKDMPLRTTSKGKRMCWYYNIKVDDRVMPPPPNVTFVGRRVAGKSLESMIFIQVFAREGLQLLLGMLKQQPVVVVDRIVSTSYADIAKDRTQAMRKWLLRACELKDLEPPFPMPDHCSAVLKNKSMPLFAEMLEAADYPDKDLVKTMCSGFDLLGQIPASGVLPEKHMDVLLTINEVRSLTPEVRSAILHQRDDGKDLEILAAVHKLTLEERDRAWLRGPLKSSEIPSDSVITRQFGIKQSSTDAEKGKVTKIRPIDDYTQSLANLTCGSTETISPHGVDVICAGISYRIRRGRQLGLRERLVSRAIDLRKAYKNLPLSTAALRDSYLAVLNPATSQYEFFQALVLPFGARPAVQGFYRVASAIWYLALTFFDLHWTQFYDYYYFLIAGEAEGPHVNLIQESFYALLGWETASETDCGFGFVTRALGVQIDLSDCHFGLVKVSNTMTRRRELEITINDILANPSVSGSVLTSLRGRLLFCDNQIFGRMASLQLRILSSYCDRRGQVRLNDSLKKALIFLRDHVALGPERIVHCSFRNCFHVYSDASYEPSGGGVGALAYNSQGLLLSWFGEELSQDVMAIINPEEKCTLIYELETYAAVMSLVRLGRLWRDADVILFLDNEASLATLINGRSDSFFVQRLLNTLFEWECESRCNVWFERVPSASNPADDPSRLIFPMQPGLRARLDAKSDFVLHAIGITFCTLPGAGMACAVLSGRYTNMVLGLSVLAAKGTPVLQSRFLPSALDFLLSAWIERARAFRLDQWTPTTLSREVKKGWRVEAAGASVGAGMGILGVAGCRYTGEFVLTPAGLNMPYNQVQFFAEVPSFFSSAGRVTHACPQMHNSEMKGP